MGAESVDPSTVAELAEGCGEGVRSGESVSLESEHVHVVDVGVSDLVEVLLASGTEHVGDVVSKG